MLTIRENCDGDLNVSLNDYKDMCELYFLYKQKIAIIQSIDHTNTLSKH